MDPKLKHHIAALQAFYRGFDLDEIVCNAVAASRDLKKAKAAFRRGDIPPEELRNKRATFYALHGLQRQLMQNGGV